MHQMLSNVAALSIFLFTSPTIRSGIARCYLAAEHMQDVLFHMGAETHLRGGSLLQEQKKLKKAGWLSTSSPAVPTATEGALGHGGVWVLARTTIHSQVSYPCRVGPDGQAQFFGTQWVGRNVRFKGLEITFVAVYLNDSEGVVGTNGLILEELAGYLLTVAKHYIVMADWNMTPKDLWDSGWPSFVRGSIVTPPGEFTNAGGSGRVLDFGVVSEHLTSLVTLALDFQGPWAPHLGVFGKLDLSQEALEGRVMVPVTPILNHAFGPDLPWEHFQQEAGAVEAPRDYYVWEEATSDSLSRMYANFSMQAEAFLLNRSGREPSPHKRGMCPEVTVKNLTAVKPPGHFGRSEE
eukprot:1944074-Pyramimonas_sp.AAC.2